MDRQTAELLAAQLEGTLTKDLFSAEVLHQPDASYVITVESWDGRPLFTITGGDVVSLVGIQ